MNDILVMAIIFGAFSIFDYVIRSYYSDIEQEAIKNMVVFKNLCQSPKLPHKETTHEQTRI